MLTRYVHVIRSYGVSLFGWALWHDQPVLSFNIYARFVLSDGVSVPCFDDDWIAV